MQHDHRAIFYDVWQKHQRNQLLNDFESEVLNVLLKYPQYTQNMTRD